MADLWIGTSGFSYRHWRGGVFYPPGLPAARELEFYAERFPTVELNNSFYHLPTREQFEAWRRRAPAGFRFAVKASRYITHIRKLKECGPALRLFEERLAGLGAKLGPVLFQLPAAWGPDLDRLAAFLPLLPRRWKVAMEFRHPDWWTPGCFGPLCRQLEAAGVALCWAVTPEQPEPRRELTASWVYLRFHAGRLPGGDFSDSDLRRWARRLGELPAGYAYFNNDGHGYAPRNAARLRALLTSAPRRAA